MTASPATSSGPFTSAQAGAKTAAQTALAIPEILENVRHRATYSHRVCAIRLVARRWREAVDAILLGRTRLNRGILVDLATWQELDGIIASQGGRACIRGLYVRWHGELRTESALDQFFSCSGLFSLSVCSEAIPVIAAYYRQRITGSLPAFPHLRQLGVEVIDTAHNISAEDVASLRIAAPAAGVTLCLHVQRYMPFDRALAILRPLAKEWGCCISVLRIVETAQTTPPSG